MSSAIANAPVTNRTSNTAAPAPVMAPVPFVRASTEHAEIGPDNSYILSTQQQNYGPFDIPTYGYLRSLLVFVQATASGNAAAVTAGEDSPWNVFAELSVKDINGANIVGPVGGYETYLMHKYGGLRNQCDPKLLTAYQAVITGSGGTGGSFGFQLRIAIERNARDGLGALANMNASQAYKLAGTINNYANIYGTTGPTAASCTARVRVSIEAYSQPTATDASGRMNATVPPASGTSGYYSRIQPTTNAGSTTVRMTRVGNYIRNLIYINRRAGTSRANGETDLANTYLTWYLDTRLLTGKLIEQLRMNMTEWYELILSTFETAGGLDNGVFCYSFMHEFDGKAGYELRDLWLPTTQATRFELVFTLPNSGVLTVITDDVAPKGYVFVS